MKKMIFSALMLLFFSAAYAASLTISVKFPDGKPAKGVNVQVRRAYFYDADWSLGKTDAAGRISCVFNSAESKGKDVGYGIYEFAVMPENMKWETSSIYFWTGGVNEKHISDEFTRCEKRKWNCIKAGISDKLIWDVTLPNAVTVTAKLCDMGNNPIKLKNVSLSLALFKMPHGEAFEYDYYMKIGKVMTDENGNIMLKQHVPNSYSFYFEDEEYISPNYKMNGFKNVIISPVNGDRTAVFVKNRKEEITVRARDFDTKEPLEGACVNSGRRSQEIQLKNCLAKTNKDGIFYSDEFRPELMERFGASADGYHEEWLDIDSFQPGGSYEFELKKKE